MVTGDQIESKTFDVKNHVKKNETGEVNKKVKSLGAHYKDTEKSVISIVKYLDETLETLDVKKKNQLRKKALRPNGATKDVGNPGCQECKLNLR